MGAFTMVVRLVIAVTDAEWFNHLRTNSELSEVNFWAPGAAPFKALRPGELFLFKLHAPLNFIVGGGVFAYANTIPCSLAWEAFHEGNGAARCGEPVLVRPRLGQGTFRVIVTDAYQRRCAVTGERTLPALEAAHIKPFAEGGSHEPNNGLLLRRDIHALFDSGYVIVAPDLRFNVSRRIKEEFENGRDYYQLHGRPISSPTSNKWKPEATVLAWHNEMRFLG